jgi:hypothetical protein
MRAEEDDVAIAVKFSVANMPANKYDEVLRRLEAVGAGTPPGRLHHVSYGSLDSLQVIDVFDSPQSLEGFGKILQPILSEMGISARPEIEEAYRVIKA